MLALLFETPSEPDDWNRWSFHHRDSHQRIIAAIRAQKNVGLSEYPIDPIRQPSLGDFLQSNSQMHIDMNGALGLQSSDLLEVDFEDKSQRLAWINAHAEEHRSAELALRI